MVNRGAAGAAAFGAAAGAAFLAGAAGADLVVAILKFLRFAGATPRRPFGKFRMAFAATEVKHYFSQQCVFCSATMAGCDRVRGARANHRIVARIRQDQGIFMADRNEAEMRRTDEPEEDEEEPTGSEEEDRTDRLGQICQLGQSAGRR
jgi:hypothetical protein